MFVVVYSKKDRFIAEQIMKWTHSDVSHCVIWWRSEADPSWGFVLESNDRGVNIQQQENWFEENIPIRAYRLTLAQSELQRAWAETFKAYGNVPYGYMQLVGDAIMLWVADKVTVKGARAIWWVVSKLFGYHKHLVCSELVCRFLMRTKMKEFFTHLNPELVAPDQLEAPMKENPTLFPVEPLG